MSQRASGGSGRPGRVEQDSEIEDRGDPWTSATATQSATAGLVPVDPDPQRFRQARVLLLAEGVLLIALGLWAVIAAARYQGSAPDGAPVLFFRFTMIHAGVILATGVLAIISAGKRRLGLVFSALQAVCYLFVFIISAGNLNSFSDGADSVLHGVLAAIGLVLLMWIAARALNGSSWRRRQSGNRAAS